MPVIFYCPELIDYYTFVPVLKHLKPVLVASNNSQVISHLKNLNISTIRIPTFPKAVIMCRHATHKFPCGAIVRVGMRHGPYHFKKMTKAMNYNRFDIYLFTSKCDLRAAQEIGVTVGKSVGFPRLDPAFDKSITQSNLDTLADSLGLDQGKPTLLFTATWQKSGMSAIDLWYNKLDQLQLKYNVLVTLHPWTQDRYRHEIQATKGVSLINDPNMLPYIMLSDICIGDTSSILAECAALGKPIIRFETSAAPRSLIEIDELLSSVSVSVRSFTDLVDILPKVSSLSFPQRSEAVRIMFDDLDGKAGYRAAQEIIHLLPELQI